MTGAAAGAAGGTTGAEGFAGGATAGFGATGEAAGFGGGAVAASFFWVMARSTSPGREMCDRSILVLISSSPRSVRAERADEVCASDEPRMWTRTFSASCSSRELECVFFSVTPTSGSASRMALLLTSSSLARSLIRTLLIRPFCCPALCLGLHRSLTESAFWGLAHNRNAMRVSYLFSWFMSRVVGLRLAFARNRFGFRARLRRSFFTGFF